MSKGFLQGLPSKESWDAPSGCVAPREGCMSELVLAIPTLHADVMTDSSEVRPVV